jgi:hypothetical protein
MVIAANTLWMLAGSHGTPRRNFSFPQIPQIFADFSALICVISDTNLRIKSDGDSASTIRKLDGSGKSQAEVRNQKRISFNAIPNI